MTTYSVFQSDVLNGLMHKPDNYFDMAFADPPYNLGVDYGDGPAADAMERNAYRAWFDSWLFQLQRVVRPGGSVWVLISERHADFVGESMTSLVGDRRARIIWHERFAQYNKHNFTNEHRHLFQHVVPGDKPVWNTEGILVPSVRMKKGDKRAAGPRVPGDVWEVSRVQGNNKQRVDWHPAQLNQKPLERIVLSCTNEGDRVIEPFTGSGSMMMACIRLGRHYFGIDNNPDYVMKSMDRAREYTAGLEKSKEGVAA